MPFWLISCSGIFVLLQLYPAFLPSADAKNGSMRLDDFVRFYEIISLQQTKPLSKRDLSKRASQSVFSFRAFGRAFHLKLTPSSLPEAALKIYGKHGTVIESTTTTDYSGSLYHGTVNGDLHSRVEGFFLEIGFRCIVNFENETYYLEPAALYFDDIGDENLTIIYRSSDISKCAANSNNSLACDVMTDSVEFNIERKNPGFEENHVLEESSARTSSNSKSFLRTHRKGGRNRCEIELVADHTFVAYLNNNIRDVITVLYFHAKQADHVFRKADFDLNGIADGVRLLPTQIVIYNDEDARNYPLAGVSSNDATDFLLNFSRRTQRFCLSICFTNRLFKNNVVGLAYRANSSNRRKIGGICQRTTISRDGSLLTPNTAVITFYSRRGQLPMYLTTHTFIHELGHSFGSDHDPPQDKVCSPGGHLGNYIMNPYTTDGRLHNHRKFSPCSFKAIRRTINIRGKCLETEDNSMCGNGIREEGEECDCGSSFTCKEIDPCCTPKGGTEWDKECTLRRKSNAKCSYIESPCCTSDCAIVPASENRICSGSPDLCFRSTCDGLSPECPAGHVLKDGTPCRGTSLTCKNGTCSSSICLDNGMETCECKDENECYVCCIDRSYGSCKTAKYFGFMTSTKEPFLKPVGTPCRGGKGICVRNGYCQLNESHRILLVIMSWYATLGITALSTSSFIFVIYYFFGVCLRKLRSRSNKKFHLQVITTGT